LPPFAVRRTAGGFAARNTVPALYAWEPPSPRVRCLLACFTYLLTYWALPAAAERRSGRRRPGARGPGSRTRSARAKAAKLPGVPAVGGPARCAYGKGRT
jgi:hypothetical protein